MTTVEGSTSVGSSFFLRKRAGHTFSLNDGELRTDAAGYQLENGVLTANAFSGEPQTLIEYSYDAAGLRTQKRVTENGTTTTTDYFLHGKLLMRMKQGGDELHFFYDAQSRPQMLKYNGNYYTYQHNLQGDILAIVDSMGTQVVKYGYDAWGKPLGQPITLSSAATPIGTAVALSKLNPFRYRGYVYDDETGLYYLRSRYYNPEWGRFINADSLLGKVGNIIDHNQFAYCRNNPAARSDADGHYDREAMREYAHKWFGGKWAFNTSLGGRNMQYYNYRTDCANFVSQCLVVGKIKMNKDWHSYRTTKKIIGLLHNVEFDVAPAWRLAAEQYKYFSNPDNGYIKGDVVKIDKSGISDAAKNMELQTGDLLYFAGGDGNQPHHATIISKVENGEIFFAGHTNERFDKELSDSIGDEQVLIMRIWDDA